MERERKHRDVENDWLGEVRDDWADGSNLFADVSGVQQQQQTKSFPGPHEVTPRSERSQQLRYAENFEAVEAGFRDGIRVDGSLKLSNDYGRGNGE